MRVLAVAALALALAAAGCLRDFEQPHQVYVAKLDLSAEEVGASDVLLNVTTYLDNRGGGEARDLRLLAKAYDEGTGFLVTETEALVGTLEGDRTHSVSQTLRVPREGAIRIQVTLFEEGLATREASVTARNLDALKPQVFRTGIKISEMDFTVSDPGDNQTRPTIAAMFYLTNEGDAASEDLRVQVKAREVSTSLVADTQWLQTGAIAPGSTVLRGVNLSLPDGYNYVVEILTWRGDTIVDRAEGRVQLAPTFEVPKDQEVVTTDPNIRDFAQPTAPTTRFAGSGDQSYSASPAGVPAPSFVLVLGAVALTAAALATLRGRRSA